MSIGNIFAALVCAVLFGVLVFLAITIIKDAVTEHERHGIKVIKRGKEPKKQVECPNCHSIIEYNKRGEWYGGIIENKLTHFVRCPICQEHVITREEER